MEGKTLLKHVIIVIATAIFLYQCGTAIIKLNAKESLTISETIDVNDPRFKLPLVTVCKVDQYPVEQGIKDRLIFEASVPKNLYYVSNLSDDTISFGKHLNMTYGEMMRNFIKDIKNLEGFFQRSGKEINGISVDETFIQLYGYCFETSDYEPTKLLYIDFSDIIQEKYDIFITDPRLQTYLGPDFTSQTGDRLEISYGNDYGFVIKLEVEDLTDPHNVDNCLLDDDDRESFGDCVDREIGEDLLPELGCVPPWLSPKSQCNRYFEYGSKFNNMFFLDSAVYENYSIPSMMYVQNKAQKACKKPCLKTTILVERKRKHLSNDYEHTVDLLFNTDVSFKRKIVAYDMFNFVVDVGSSLGLWLGLSILNITDTLINFANKLNLKKLLYK